MKKICIGFFITLYIIISLVVSWTYESGNYSSCNLKNNEYDGDVQKKTQKMKNL